MDTKQGPVSASELLARIRQDRKARRGFQAPAWVIVAGGLFELAQLE
jgi:hypothetical protein